MKKYFITIFILLILASCSNSNINSNSNGNGNGNGNEGKSEEVSVKQNITSHLYESKKIENKNIFEAKASGGTTDFIAFNINSLNFNEQNPKIDGVLNKSNLQKDKIQIVFEASNHVYSYENIDYLKDITLSGINPVNYKIISTKMGGHHVIVLLDFEIGTKIGVLKLKNSPVGDITLQF